MDVCQRCTHYHSPPPHPVVLMLLPGEDIGNEKGFIAFNFELRDKGRKGFVLPKREIKPSGDEIYAAIKYAAEYAVNHL